MKNLRDQGRLVEALLILLKRLTPIAKWSLVLLLAIYGFSGIRTIQPNENALVLRLGKLQPGLHGPGLLWTFPEPFEQALIFATDKELNLPLDDWMAQGEKRLSFESQREPTAAEKEDLNIEGATGQKITVKHYGDFLDPINDGYTITGDNNIVQGRFVLRYRIVDPFHYFSAGDSVGPVLTRLSYRALTHQFAIRTIDELLTTDRNQVTSLAVDSIQSEASRLQLGVSITGLDLLTLAPPTQVIASFEDVINARQHAKTLTQNAHGYRNQIHAQTEGEARAIRLRSDAVANVILTTAEGECAAFTAFHQEYRKSPVITTERIYWDSVDSVMRQVNSRALLPADQARPTIMVEPSPEFLR